MIRLKNERDIIEIKRTIKIGESILDEIASYLEPGIKTIIINNLIEIMIAKERAFPSFKGYKGFPFASCISINEEIIHGLPSERRLQNGDIVKIDIGIKRGEFYSDQARSYLIGEPKDYRHYELINTCKEALTIASWACKSGNNLMDVSKIIYEIAKRDNFGILQGFGGHGVGFEVHEEPFVPNYAPYNDIELKKGMVICLEPMFVLGKGIAQKSENGWTIITDGISAHEEKTTIIE